MANSTPTIIDVKSLELLMCPVSRAPLKFNEETQELICEKSHLAYPIRDGIPILLEAEARHLDD